MKKIYLLIVCLPCFIFTNAQMAADPRGQFTDTRRFIEVSGSAEMNLQPDEIELEVILQEYDRSGRKIKLDNINDSFYAVLRKNKMKAEDLEFINNANYYYWWYWWSYRNEYYQTKTITLKLSSQTNILKLVEDLNTKWVQSIRIAKSTHSKLQEYRKQVKAEAAKAAKEKATYLLESLGEELDNVLSVEEVPETTNNNNPYNYYWWYNQGSSNLLSNSNVSVNQNQGSSSRSSGIEHVASIKLRYEIKVKFAIR